MDDPQKPSPRKLLLKEHALLDYTGRPQAVELAQRADLLKARMIDDILCLWALEDPAAVLEPWKVEVYCEGDTVVEEPQIYLGVFVRGQSRPFHVFLKPNFRLQDAAPPFSASTLVVTDASGSG